MTTITMKRLKMIIICLCFAFCSIAQVQQIYVRTKSKPGKPGNPLSGVTVRIKGGVSSLVTGNNGSCSIHLNDSTQIGSAIIIMSVQKKGYQLVDQSIIGRRMAYSPEIPIVIVMVSDKELVKDKLRIEQTIQRTFERKLAAMEQELDSLRNQNVISQEEYKRKIQQLYANLENSEKRISELAKQYAKTDYDQLSDLDIVINQSIINGNFTKADSLIRQDGDLAERLNLLENDRLNSIKSRLEKYDTEIEKERNSLAQDCYQFFKVYRDQLQYDTAAYYIELRAKIDTSNVEWNLDAGKFIMDYLFGEQNDSKAKNYFNRALQICLKKGESNSDIAKTYIYLGDLNNKWGNYGVALDYYSYAYQVYSADQFHVFTDAPEYLERIALAYNSMKKYDEALNQHQITLSMCEEKYPERKDLIANCHINIGTTYENMGNYLEAISYYQKALSLLDSISDTPRLAHCYNNFGSAYDRQEQYDEAIKYYEKSLSMYTELYGPIMRRQLDIGYLYNNLASTYYNKSEYVEALKYYIEALRILGFRLDKNHPTVKTVQENIMTTINEMCLN